MQSQIAAIVDQGSVSKDVGGFAQSVSPRRCAIAIGTLHSAELVAVYVGGCCNRHIAGIARHQSTRNTYTTCTVGAEWGIR